MTKLGKNLDYVKVLVIGQPKSYSSANVGCITVPNGVVAVNVLTVSGIDPDIVIVNCEISRSQALALKGALVSIEGVSQFHYVMLKNKQNFKISDFNFVNEILSADMSVEQIVSRYKLSVPNDGFSEDHSMEQKLKISFAKRAFDIVTALVALILLSPFLFLVICLIKVSSRGPIFYVSKRVGRGYRVFDFYKFRTMAIGADKKVDNLLQFNQYLEVNSDLKEGCTECQKQKYYCSTPLYYDDEVVCEKRYLYLIKAKENAAFFKLNNDPRISIIGRILRKTSIDEIPQLWNVIKGDMSIVGNRPLPLYEAVKLTNDDWSERFLAPAGLTGLWQISRRGQTKMDDKERKQLDNIYYRNQSFFGDLLIILKTFPALVQKADV